MRLPQAFERFYRRLDGHMQEVVRGTSQALSLKVVAGLLAFGFNLVLARMLGVEGAGLYFLVLTIVSIAAVLGRVGLDNAALRFVAANAAMGAWSAVRGVYNQSVAIALAASGAITAILWIAAPLLAETVFSKPELTDLLRHGSLAVVPLALCMLHGQFLCGLKRVRETVLVASVLVPLFSLIGVLVLAPLKGVSGAVWAYLLATTLTLLLARWLWRKAAPQLTEIEGRFDTARLLATSVTLLVVAVMQLVISWSSYIMLGIWAGSADLGIFGAASRTAALVSFLLAATTTIVVPKFAALYRQGDIQALGDTARNSTRLMMLAASPVFFLFLCFSERVMLLFGSEFGSGGLTLCILAAGQLVHVATGAVGYLLIMCGYEHLMRNNAAFCMIINVLLNGLLIPSWGAEGAAIATAVTLVLQNTLAVAIAWWKLGIVTVAMPSLRSTY